MRQHGLTLRGFGDDRLAEPMFARQEGCDAAGIVRFLVRREQERSVAFRHLRGGNQRGGRALDVAGTQADGTVAFDTQHVWIGAPRRRRRHGVQMHVEHALGLSAHGEERHRAGAVVGHFDGEVHQLRAQIVEDPVGADVARRVAGVEGHQLIEVLENGWQHGVCPWTVVVSNVIPAYAGIHFALASGASEAESNWIPACAGMTAGLFQKTQRLISAHRVELMPNSLMKPSASSTPQSADCA